MLEPLATGKPIAERAVVPGDASYLNNRSSERNADVSGQNQELTLYSLPLGTAVVSHSRFLRHLHHSSS